MDVLIFTAFSIEIFVRKSIDPDQMPHLAAYELGMHCLHNTTKTITGLKGLILSGL